MQFCCSLDTASGTKRILQAGNVSSCHSDTFAELERVGVYNKAPKPSLRMFGEREPPGYVSDFYITVLSD